MGGWRWRALRRGSIYLSTNIDCPLRLVARSMSGIDRLCEGRQRIERRLVAQRIELRFLFGELVCQCHALNLG
jgi:hypothetical protein